MDEVRPSWRPLPSKRRRVFELVNSHGVSISLSAKVPVASLPQFSAVTIRRATKSDAANVAALLAALGYPNSSRDVESRIQSHTKSETAAVFVAESDGKVVGFASFQQVPL